MKTAADLRAWEIPDAATFSDTPGGLVRLDIATPLVTAEVYLHGAHITMFQPAGTPPVLFLSDKSHFNPSKAIRGGVPIIFPWFGPKSGQPELPAHGFVRTMEWDIESLSLALGGEVHLILRVASNDATRALWPHDFVIRYRIVFGTSLEMTLETENTSAEPFIYEDALHTYLTVADVLEVTVCGLSGAEYLDKVDGGKRKVQDQSPIRIEEETDRLYLNTTTTCTVDDPSLSRRIIVEKSGSDSTVVWNPWQGKGMSLADLGAEWPRMICIETVNAAENAITLAPGARHATRALVRVEQE
jgi:glucose-6-phosphate 1-epimerase